MNPSFELRFVLFLITAFLPVDNKLNDTWMRLKGFCYFIHVTSCLQFFPLEALAQSVEEHKKQCYILYWLFCHLNYMNSEVSYVLNQQISLLYDFYQDEAIGIIWHTAEGLSHNTSRVLVKWGWQHKNKWSGMNVRYLKKLLCVLNMNKSLKIWKRKDKLDPMITAFGTEN